MNHKLVILVALGVIVRFFHWGGKFRECCGDVLIGAVIMMFAAVHLPNVTFTIPQVGEVTFTYNEIVFVLGMLGYKGLKEVIFGVLKNGLVSICASL